MDKFKEDLPIYINGFAVGMLLYSIPELSIFDFLMFAVAMITFLWYGKKRIDI